MPEDDATSYDNKERTTEILYYRLTVKLPSNLNTDSSHLVKRLHMTTSPVVAIENSVYYFKNSWNPNPKPFNKSDIEMQAFSEDTVFPYKELRKVESTVQPSLTKTTSKSDSSSNHPELTQHLHRSPHDNRSLRDNRLHHHHHLLNPFW